MFSTTPRIGRAAVVAGLVAAPAFVASVAVASPNAHPASTPAAGVAECVDIDAGAIAELALTEALEQIPDVASFASAFVGSGLSIELAEQGPFTIFAPSDAAIEAIPVNVFDAMIADQDLLVDLVGLHIVTGEQLDAAQIASVGELNSLSGPLTITSDDGAVTVNGEAGVTCGGIEAADATIFVIDRFLTPVADLGCGETAGSSVPGSSVAGSSVPGSSTPASAADCAAGSSVPGSSVPGSSTPAPPASDDASSGTDAPGTTDPG